MKNYRVNILLKEIKKKEKEEKKIKDVLSNLLPGSVEELKECIRINEILSKDYF